MRLSDYQRIIKYIQDGTYICNRTALCDVLQEFRSLANYETLLSVFLNHIQRRVKVTFGKNLKGDTPKMYYQLYRQMIQDGSKTGSRSSNVLINLANRFEIPPGLMARIIVEQFLIDNNAQSSDMSLSNYQVSERLTPAAEVVAKKEPAISPRDGTHKVAFDPITEIQLPLKQKISAWVKDPYLISNTILREQVLQCISYDVCYGPINDAIRHSVGLEFELKLKKSVGDLKLPFLDENDLRKRGYDKTPDIKLEIPIAVKGHPVCWIESKASFGDLESHDEYLQGQYLSYWNRFGPGLVIYWFGFIDEIFDEMKNKGMLTMDSFPSTEDIAFMNP